MLDNNMPNINGKTPNEDFASFLKKSDFAKKMTGMADIEVCNLFRLKLEEANEKIEQLKKENQDMIHHDNYVKYLEKDKKELKDKVERLSKALLSVAIEGDVISNQYTKENIINYNEIIQLNKERKELKQYNSNLEEIRDQLYKRLHEECVNVEELNKLIERKDREINRLNAMLEKIITEE
jgi:hypothetical protein